MIHMEQSSSTTLRKEWWLLDHIMLHYWIDWLTKSGRNGHIWRRKKSSFMMTMDHLTQRTLHRQKSMNWVSNRFHIHRIFQTWPPATTICSQTLKNGYVVGVLSRTKKLKLKSRVWQIVLFGRHRRNDPCGNCQIFALLQIWPQLGKLLFGYNIANVFDVAWCQPWSLFNSCCGYSATYIGCACVFRSPPVLNPGSLNYAKDINDYVW